MGMIVSSHAQYALPPAKKPDIHWTGDSVRHRARLGVLQKREVSYQHLDILDHLELRSFASVIHNCSGHVEGISARRYE